MILLSASNPSPDSDGTTFSGPAVYAVTLAGDTATLRPVLFGDSTATDAVTGKRVTLNLSDPDSGEVVPRSVPRSVPRFGGDFVLDSQGDGELVFVAHPGGPDQHNTVLTRNAQVDDTAFVTDPHGMLFVVDNANNDIVAIRGSFRRGEAFSAVPSGSPTPAALDELNLGNGDETPFAIGIGSPHGVLFVPGDRD